MKKCVFAGSFDPFTLGHQSIVEKCLCLFDEVVVAIGINENKKSYFTTLEKLEMINSVYNDEKRVKVVSFNGLLVDLLKEENTPFCVRGVRNSTDYNYECSMNLANSQLKEDIITIFLPCKQEHLHISSSLVKELLNSGVNLTNYLPTSIVNIIKKD